MIYQIRESMRTLTQPVTCLGAAVLAFVFCLFAYLLVALATHSVADAHVDPHHHPHLFWGIVLTLSVGLLIMVGAGIWRERKLIEAMARMRHTEDVMAQSHERNHLLERALNGGVWDWNFVTDEFFLSPQWKEILGFQESDLSNVPATFFDLLHPDDKARVTDGFRAHVEEGTPYNLSMRLRCKNGEYCWVNSRGKVVRDDSNRPVRMLGVMVDISERKKAEAEIAESRDNLARAEQMARLGHFKCAQGSSERTWSDGLYRIFGKSRETFTPTAENILAQFHPEDRPILEQRHRDLSAGLAPPSRTLRVIKDDGEIIYVEDATDLIYASDGTLVGRFGTLQDVTARVQAEAQIAESRDNLARAEEMARLGHFKYETATGTLTWSAGSYRIFGKSRDTFTPTFDNVLELFVAEDRPAVLKYRNAILGGDEPPPATHRIIKDDGQLGYIEAWSRPLRAGDGTVIGLFGTIQDVTVHKQAEEALAQANKKLTDIQYAIDQAIIVAVTDVQGCITHANDAFCKISGYAREELLGANHRIVSSGHHPKAFFRDMYRQIAAGQVWRGEICNRAKDGSLYWLDTTIIPQFGPDGKPISYTAIRVDISARKQVEAMIAESRDNLARAEEMARLGHFRFEFASGQITWSAGTYRIFGKTADTFTPTPQSVLQLLHPDDRPILLAHRQALKEGAELPPITHRVVKDDGQVSFLEAWSQPLRGSDGSVIGLFGTIQDVTARKRAQEALARANQELEARVAERSAALEAEMRRRAEVQSTLAQVQKMEAVGQLSAGIAHDFNNLLAVIGGGLEFIERAAARGLPAEPELIDAALRATRRGRDLVQRLLTFARQSPLCAEPTVIDQMVLDTLRLLQRTLGEDIEIVTRLDAVGGLVSVDRNQLANALVNLALNARDAMPEGGRLTIATHCQPANTNTGGSGTGAGVCITITDTGIGMTEEVRTRAFEPFFTTKRDGLGSGLGLSMVLGFVQQSGGHISIDSKESCGTTITIRLPRIEAPAQAQDIGDTAALAPPGQDKTVLLVEDDPDVRVVVAAQLKDLGYTVHAVGNAMEAIGLIESPTSIAVVMTDIVLPGDVDGVTLLKEAMRARPRIGVLGMSGYNPSQGHRKWLQVQNIELLEKPFSSIRLAQALDSALAS